MSEKEKGIPNAFKFAFGATAGMGATCFVQPLDLIKNRMQLSGAAGKAKEYKNTLHACRTIVKKEGFFALYNGISAGLLRQLTYTGTRLGIYTYLFELFQKPDGSSPDFLTLLGCGMTAGIGGAFVGNPAEISLIRMTADGRLPPQERRNYKNVVDALIRIYREEGLLTLWRGAMPTIGRAIAVNSAQLVTYSQTKAMFAEHFDLANIPLQFCASMTSGIVTTVVSMPFDIAKTRIQNMRIIGGVAEYRGPTDVFIKVIRNEGVLALWKGFLPYYLRLGPHTVLTFIFLEQINNAYFIYVLGQKPKGGL